MCRLNVFTAIKREKQVQADWEQTDTNAVSFIKNKPNVADAKDVATQKENIKNMQSILTELQAMCNSMNGTLEGVNKNINELWDGYGTIPAELRSIKSKISDIEASNSSLISNLESLSNDFNDLREEVWKYHILSGNTFPEEALVGQLFWNTEFNMFGIYNGYAWVDSNGYQIGKHSGYGTGERPDYLNDVTDVGYPFFDRDINMMVWWNGYGWFNANGEEV